MMVARRRFAYACELLLAIIAVFTLWSQVAGQGHLDMMAWYWKLALGGTASIGVTGLTHAAANQPRPVNRRSLMWTLLLVAVAAGMGLVTYYYHLHEVDEPEMEEGSTAARVLFLAEG